MAYARPKTSFCTRPFVLSRIRFSADLFVILVLVAPPKDERKYLWQYFERMVFSFCIFQARFRFRVRDNTPDNADSNHFLFSLLDWFSVHRHLVFMFSRFFLYVYASCPYPTSRPKHRMGFSVFIIFFFHFFSRHTQTDPSHQRLSADLSTNHRQCFAVSFRRHTLFAEICIDIVHA